MAHLDADSVAADHVGCLFCQRLCQCWHICLVESNISVMRADAVLCKGRPWQGLLVDTAAIASAGSTLQDM